MELRKGCKESEAGVIPNDWNAKTIGETLKIKHGKDQKEVQSENGIYPILGTGGLMGYANCFLYDKESVLIGRKGTIDKPKYMNSPFWTVDTLFYSEVNPNYLAKYIYYNFLLIDWYAYNEASGVPSLNAKTIENIYIPLPPTKAEQTAIANALSDADALISSLETLIEKKRNIKQGAMQQLLKPKKSWVVKKLGEIVIYKNGTAHENSVVENGEYIIVNSKFISSDAQVAKYSNEILCPVLKDEILMVLSDVPNGKAIAKCFLVEKNNKYTLNQRICSLKSINSDPKFLYYLLNRNPYFLGFDDGAKQTNLRNIDVLNCPLTIPPTIEEQIKIATILSDMDNEITALEKKLSKSKMLKQGMMQELLTGKIRLV